MRVRRQRARGDEEKPRGDEFSPDEKKKDTLGKRAHGAVHSLAVTPIFSLSFYFSLRYSEPLNNALSLYLSFSSLLSLPSHARERVGFQRDASNFSYERRTR